MKQGKTIITVTILAMAAVVALYFGYYAYNALNEPYVTTQAYAYTAHDSVAAEGLVELTRLATGRLSASDWGKLTQAARTLRQTDIRIDDNPMLTAADMNAKCRRLENLGLVVVDYLQLMSSSGGKSYAGENRQQAVSDISRMLKVMAKELNVPVICLSQLSRANEKREDKRPMLSDLRDSGAI